VVLELRRLRCAESVEGETGDMLMHHDRA
jgi:hypothetical protein